MKTTPPRPTSIFPPPANPTAERTAPRANDRPRRAFAGGLRLAAILGALTCAAAACQETPKKPTVAPKIQASSAAAAKAGDHPASDWRPKAMQLAPSRVVNAPALPPGHDNKLPPGHPPIDGAPAGGPEQAVAKAAVEGAGGLPGTAGPSGPVEEILQAGRYTYLRIGKVWSAVPVAHVKIGQDVAIVGAMKMTNFVSKATGRTFPSVWFGNLAVRRDAVDAMKERGGAKTPAPRPSTTKPVAKAEGEGAYTVAEIIAQREQLKGKRVRVHARVVKFNAEILNRNWLHLQDGSGDRNAKTDDLTVTSDASAKVGDVVLVEGVVAINRDFGAGYSYPVLLEKAAIKPAP